MNILLAFSPFLAFALVDRLVGVEPGLLGGAVVALGLLLRDALSRGRSIKVLEVGTVILFGGLAAYAYLAHPAWSILTVRLCVDAGLLVIVLFSMAIGQPFTIQYARDTVPANQWGSPEFRRVNYVITGIWAGAFALLVAADLFMLYVPAVPMRVGIWVTVLALVGAVKFTSWYTERKQ